MIKNFFYNMFPISKIFLVLSIILSSLIILDYRYNYFLILLFLFNSIAIGNIKVLLKRVIIIITPIWISIFLFQSIFIKYSGKIYNVFFINFYHEGIMRFFQITSLLTVFIVGITFLTMITNVKKLSISLEQIGVSPKFIYLIMTTINMIDDLQERGKVIIESQQTRGIEIGGNFFKRVSLLVTIFIPLVLTSLTNAEERAIALETRGFSISSKKTLLNTIEIRKIDKIVNVFSVFIIICSVAIKFIFIF